jgi:hypothetical protein
VPAVCAVGAIKLRDSGGLSNVQSQDMVLCHGRGWVEDGSRGFGLWPGKTLPFSGGKNTREPWRDSRRRRLRQTEVGLRRLHLNTRRERDGKPEPRRLPLAKRGPVNPRLRPPSWRALRCAEAPRAPLGLDRTRFTGLLTQACLQAIPLGAIACKQAPENRVNLSSKANGNKQESQNTEPGHRGGRRRADDRKVAAEGRGDVTR